MTPRLFSFVTTSFMYDLEQLHQLCSAGRVQSPAVFGDLLDRLPDMSVGSHWRNELDGLRAYSFSIKGYFSTASASQPSLASSTQPPVIGTKSKNQKEKDRKERKRQRDALQQDIAVKLQAASTASSLTARRSSSSICCYNLSTKGCDKGTKCRYEHRSPGGIEDEKYLDTFFTGRSDGLKRKQ